jgi:hypothetical protein
LSQDFPVVNRWWVAGSHPQYIVVWKRVVALLLIRWAHGLFGTLPLWLMYASIISIRTT